MRRYAFPVVGVMMGLCLLIYSGASGNLGESTVVLDPMANCYQSGEIKSLCFLVTNASPDGEAIADIELGFPEGWAVMDCCDRGDVCRVDGGYVRT